ncbi:hypothetical protein AUEXF2481DRAFT_40259 [Aureobasidium subglaciale EXF-2481]|uniref:Zn(2)-C6 fungal-type domain-containing protein n=1 Tax=Aureobasidium subglaciale (strain EXF-2481) TaxID=1043005 RepID=A0A074YG17_AURSE|nr:uncharacterized protein AUEXF2481DRAFT_40259 [Aureobasidium subglaciale EXF-2481]KEQ95004.1 hypothetical protein AUEXF2481DRAFT_40259 [Aureobasidium subglaciale EXF-2481]
MKRSAPETSTIAEPQATRRRQDPVSCGVCRRKKLKCSRTFPCSNCVSRGLNCEPPEAMPRVSGQARSSSVVPSDNSVLAQVLERLQKLENIVLANGNEMRRDKTQAGPEPLLTMHEDVVQNDIFHAISRSDSSPQANVERQREDEFRSTDITASRRIDAVDNQGEFLFTSAGVSEIAFDLNLEDPILTNISVKGSRVVRRICLPAREEANILFQSYDKSLGSWYHIYHRQTVEALIDETYCRIVRGQAPSLSHAALLLSIFVSGAYFQALAEWPESVFPGSQEANRLSTSWKQNALDILDHLERTTTTSIEQLQATIIMSLMMQNFEGLSKKFWLLHCTSITLAKDLSIHVLDLPSRVKPGNKIEGEVKRRIWWYLATTDWLLGSMPSPQEGTYSIHPRHAHVNRPMNINDDELLHEEETSDKPLTEPTEMSYFLVRTVGGEMCRILADLVHPLASGVNSVDYDEIVALEKRTAGLKDDLPFYFQLDEESRRRTEPYLSKYPQLATQKYLLQQGLHCHRSRIHRPFLIRGSTNARFNVSRTACLESVRKCIEICRLLRHEKRDAVLPITRLNFVLYHIFMAALTLALDLCFNKSASEAEDQSRRAELKEACSMLQESRTEMPAANRFITALMDLLRKHKIQLQDARPKNQYLTPSESTATPAVQPTGMVIVPPAQNEVAQSHGPPEWNTSLDPVPDLELDKLWEEFINMAPGSSASGWDDLLADFDQASLFIGV